MKRKSRIKSYYKHRDSELKRSKENHRAERFKAFQIIGCSKEPKCVYCNCNDIRILEVNHKNGQGTKRKEHGSALYYRIARGFREDTSDLEVTCRVCNAFHYVNKKYGVNYKIEFLG